MPTDEKGAAAPTPWRDELRAFLQLSTPVVVSTLSRFLMVATDIAFVGKLGTEELAACSLCNVVMSIFASPAYGASGALNTLCAQAFGAKNYKLVGVWLQLAWTSMIVASIPGAIGFWLIGDILAACGVSARVSELAGIFARVSIGWLVPNALYQTARFYFQAQGMPVPAMVNNILFVFVNFGLNAVLVRGVGSWQGLGFAGSALATTISRILQCAVYFLYMFGYRKAHLRTWPGWCTAAVFTRSRVREFVGQAVPQSLSILGATALDQLSTFLAASISSLALAMSSGFQTAVLGTLLSVVFGLGMGAQTRVGHQLGTGDGTAAKRACIIGAACAASFSVVSCSALWGFRHVVGYIFSSDDAVVELVDSVIPLAVGLNVAGCATTIFSATLKGMARARLDFFLAFFARAFFGLGLSALAVLKWDLGVRGLFSGLLAGDGALALIMLLVLLRTDWNNQAALAVERSEVKKIEKAAADEGTPLIDPSGNEE